jgi:hypothetical protein
MPPNDRRWADRARMRRAASAHTSPTKVSSAGLSDTVLRLLFAYSVLVCFSNGLCDLKTGFSGGINPPEPKLILATSAIEHIVNQA